MGLLAWALWYFNGERDLTWEHAIQLHSYDPTRFSTHAYHANMAQLLTIATTINARELDNAVNGERI